MLRSPPNYFGLKFLGPPPLFNWEGGLLPRKWYPFKNYEKCFLFHQKSSFSTQDIQSFVFSSSLPFFPVTHCLRGWSKKNLKIYDIINCLNKNLITHFVWYLEKEMRCDIETLFIVRELNMEHFFGKIMQNMCFKS